MKKEAYTAAHLPAHSNLDSVAKRIRKECECEHLLITRASKGMTLYSEKNSRQDFPTHARSIVDVTGAGDTVFAVIAVALGSALSLEHAAVLSNVAAGLAVQEVGCAAITLEQMASHFLEIYTEGKVFSLSHIPALVYLLERRGYLVVSMEANGGISGREYNQLQEIREKYRGWVVLYLKGYQEDKEYLSLLSAMDVVDFVLTDVECVSVLQESVVPEATYAIEQAQVRNHR